MDKINDVIQLDWEIHILHKQCIAHLLYDCNIHFGQPPLLFMLKQMGACNQNELSKALRVSPATIAVSLKRIEKSGFLKRIPDPADLRSKRIELTAEGLKAAEYAESVIRQVTACTYEGFSQEEFDQFIHFYKRMQQNLSNYKNQFDETEESI